MGRHAFARYNSFGKRLNRYKSLLDVCGFWKINNGKVESTIQEGKSIVIPMYKEGLEVVIADPFALDTTVNLPAKHLQMPIMAAFMEIGCELADLDAFWSWPGMQKADLDTASEKSGASLETETPPAKYRRQLSNASTTAESLLADAIRSKMKGSGSASSAAPPS